MSRYTAIAPVTIAAGERSRMIRAGEVVDFDDVIVPARGTTPALTLGACVNPDHFSSAGAAAGRALGRRKGPIGAAPPSGPGAIARAAATPASDSAPTPAPDEESA